MVNSGKIQVLLQILGIFVSSNAGVGSIRNLQCYGKHEFHICLKKSTYTQSFSSLTYLKAIRKTNIQARIFFDN